jgi:catechol 2,3-dioxygenase-like lactoylglutathione lyase family enzyme
MLGDKNTIATVAVRDLQAARRFYEETLGLRLLETEGEEALTFATGATRLLVYRSEFAGTNPATAVTWAVGADVDAIARDLAAKGVRFERYEMPDVTMEGDVHVFGDMRVAWFRDPDGAIFSLVSG